MKFAEQLELEAFPFDVQDFTIHMKAEKSSNFVDILPYPRYALRSPLPLFFY